MRKRHAGQPGFLVSMSLHPRTALRPGRHAGLLLTPDAKTGRLDPDIPSYDNLRPVSVTNPDRGHILLPSPAAGEEPAPGANGKIPRSAPERPTSPGLVQQAGLEPLPASPSRLSVRRQNESPRSMHGDGPYCYLNNPGFEPCPTILPPLATRHSPLATTSYDPSPLATA